MTEFVHPEPCECTACVPDETEKWRQLALHALSDLRMLGIEIEKIILMTPAVLRQVDEYDRDQTSFS